MKLPINRNVRLTGLLLAATVLGGCATMVEDPYYQPAPVYYPQQQYPVYQQPGYIYTPAPRHVYERDDWRQREREREQWRERERERAEWERRERERRERERRDRDRADRERHSPPPASNGRMAPGSYNPAPNDWRARQRDNEHNP